MTRRVHVIESDGHLFARRVRDAHKLKKEGLDAVKSAPVIALGLAGMGAGWSGFYSLADLLQHQPQARVKDYLIATGILSVLSGAAVAVKGAGQIAVGKLKEGRNFKRIKKEVWRLPGEAKFVAEKFRKYGVEEKLVEKVLGWGKGKK